MYVKHNSFKLIYLIDKLMVEYGEVYLVEYVKFDSFLDLSMYYKFREFEGQPLSEKVQIFNEAIIFS